MERSTYEIVICSGLIELAEYLGVTNLSPKGICEICGREPAKSGLCPYHYELYGESLADCDMCGRYIDHGRFCESCRRQIGELEKGKKYRANYFGNPLVIQKFREKYKLPIMTGFVHGRQLLKRLRSIISDANREILVSSPWITLNEISNELEAKAEEGLKVRVLSQRAEKRKNRTKNPHFDLFKLWLESRIEIVVDDDIHAKMIIVDGRVMYLGSSNITETGLYRALETGIVTEDSTLVKPAHEHLKKLFRKAKKQMITKQT